MEHLCDLECSDIFVNAEVVALDDEDVGGGEHVRHPFHFQPDVFVVGLLHDDESEGEVRGKVGDDLAVAFTL